MDPLILLIVGVVALVVVLITLIQTWGRLLRKVGPNQALIVYGAVPGGTKVITGGSKFVVPLYQRAQEFSLELMSFDVAPAQDLYTSQGVAVNVEAVTQIKVRSDEESVKTAAEQFLSKSQQEREGLIRLVMEGHLRGIVGQLTVEELVKDPENVGSKMLKTVTPDMEKMGLEVIHLPLRMYVTRMITSRTWGARRSLRLRNRLTLPQPWHNGIRRSNRLTPPAKHPSPNLPQTRCG